MASVLTPTATAPAAPAHAATADRHGGEDCPPDGLGPELTAPLDEAIEQTPSGGIEDATDWNPSWAWAAGAMISNLHDLHDLRRWAGVLATGELLSPAAQAQRLRTLPTGFPGTGYGLGIFETNGWIGHNGSLPGYETVTVYLPARKATLVVMINTDATSRGQEPSTLRARAITGIVTPDNVYAGAVRPS
ncbi:serine hydrolase [Streptomyces sp. NPDC056528]|uniref:serine hydrolase n=1 Tax=Streptomyces sp. NPDC056528 TaxID=3345854 RepID=UPI00368D7A3A